jgi:hypothetical protein
MQTRFTALIGVVCVLGLMTACSGVANASLNSGSLTNAAGVTATDGWNTDPGFEITWQVSMTPKGWDGTIDLYHYVYTLTSTTGGDLNTPVSRFGLGVSSTFTMADERNVTANGETVTPPIVPNWNDLAPAMVFGFSSPTKNLTIAFDSDRAPVWGDFFAGDGKVDGVDCWAYDDGLVDNEGEQIAVPDSKTTTVVPEPATLIVWSLLGAASWLGMRVWRGGQRISRRSWSPDNRQAILDIIDRTRSH